MIVYNEHGEKWEVTRGDPAWEEVNYLARLGYSPVRLPTSVILSKGSSSIINPIPERADFLALVSLADQVAAVNDLWYSKESNDKA